MKRLPNGQFAPGNEGSSGRPPGSIDRAKAVEQAICIKAREIGKEGVHEWLATLDDKELSQLYGRLLSREQKHQVTAEVSFADALAEVEAIEAAERALLRDSAQRSAKDHGVVSEN